MLKLFRYTMGNTELYGPAENEQEAYEQRAQLDHTFEWTPVVIEEVKVEGYTIVCVSDEELAAEEALIDEVAQIPYELPTDDEGQAELPMPAQKGRKKAN